jgi:hypothetical protein
VRSEEHKGATADLRRKHRGVKSGDGCGPAEDAVRQKVRSGAECDDVAGVEWPSVRSGAGCGACQSEDAVEEEERIWAPLGFPSCCKVRNASAARLTARERTTSVRQVNTDRCEATFARMLKLNRRRAITRGAPSGCGKDFSFVLHRHGLQNRPWQVWHAIRVQVPRES